MRRLASAVVGGLLVLAGWTPLTRAAEVYRGAAEGGQWLGALRLHTDGPALVPALGVLGRRPLPRGAAHAPAEDGVLRYDARNDTLQWWAADAGAPILVEPDFAARLSMRSGGRPANALRLMAGGGPPPRGLVLKTAAGEQRLDPDALQRDGGFTVFEPGLSSGFELRIEAPDLAGQAGDPALALSVDLGHTAIVRVQVGHAGGEVSRPGGAMHCAASGCERRATFATPGDYFALQASRPTPSTLEFTGWGNDCRSSNRVVALSLDPARDEFWCSAGFAPPASQAKGATSVTLGNGDPIAVPGTGTEGIASLYPSSINVAAVGPIARVRVTLPSVSHAHPDDLDILLQAPRENRAAVILMSDACGPDDISGYLWNFYDDAPAGMTDTTLEGCFPFDVRPTNFGEGDVWDAPAPAASHAALLSTFIGDNPIGAWRLFVSDDGAGDIGALDSGWQLTFDVAPHEFLIPGASTLGPAGSYPAQQLVSGQGTQILDVNLVLDGVSHAYPDDMDMLLVSPAGTAVLVLSDVCGASDITNFFWRLDDEAAAPMGDEEIGPCSPFDVQPTNFGAGADAFPAPAPAGPYATTLAAFDGENPNGIWRLYVVDDLGGDGGFLRTGWSLEISTERVFANGFEAP